MYQLTAIAILFPAKLGACLHCVLYAWVLLAAESSPHKMSLVLIKRLTNGAYPLSCYEC
jgi:hypothetical protein